MQYYIVKYVRQECISKRHHRITLIEQSMIVLLQHFAYSNMQYRIAALIYSINILQYQYVSQITIGY